MAVINYSKKEISAKIVYYGPSLCGKTTNIQSIYASLKPEQKGKLVSLATEADRTLFFDFLPIEIANIRGFKTRLHFYTVPGQVYYNSTRRAVLTGVDGVVFVADSQRDKMEENIESLNNLEENLNYYGKSIKTLPLVFQYNKRDLPDVAPVSEMEQILNPYGYPFFEAVATTGEGVLETLTRITKMVLQHIEKGTSGRQARPAAEAMPHSDAARSEPYPRQAPGLTSGMRPSESPSQHDMMSNTQASTGVQRPAPSASGRAETAGMHPHQEPERPFGAGVQETVLKPATAGPAVKAQQEAPVHTGTTMDYELAGGLESPQEQPTIDFQSVASPAEAQTVSQEPLRGTLAEPYEHVLETSSGTQHSLGVSLGRIQIVGTEPAEIISANALSIPVRVKIEGDNKVYRIDLAIKIDGLKV